MDRIKILDYLNKVIEEEHGIKINEDNLLVDCNIDSFGYAIFWCSVEDTFNIKYSKEEANAFSYDTLTVKCVIDGIVSKIDENK